MLEVETEMIASALMGWLRFGKQFHYVAREVGMFSSDVLGASPRTIIEIEIKVSRSDFRADWDKDKHQIYKEQKFEHVHTYPNGTERRWQQWLPNQFYFACPAHMKEFAIEQVKEKAPDYGVIVVEENMMEIPTFTQWKTLRTVKRAKFMHKKPPPPGVLTDIVARMSSDLAHMHFHRRMDKDWLRLALDNAKAFSETPDIEKKVKLKK